MRENEFLTKDLGYEATRIFFALMAGTVSLSVLFGALGSALDESEDVTRYPVPEDAVVTTIAECEKQTTQYLSEFTGASRLQERDIIDVSSGKIDPAVQVMAEEHVQSCVRDKLRYQFGDKSQYQSAAENVIVRFQTAQERGPYSSDVTLNARQAVQPRL